jgi:hypothetical protein
LDFEVFTGFWGSFVVAAQRFCQDISSLFILDLDSFRTECYPWSDDY